MPIPLRRSGSSRRGPFRGPHRTGSLFLPLLALSSTPLSSPMDPQAGRSPRQVLRRSTFFFPVIAPRETRLPEDARRLVYRNSFSFRPLTPSLPLSPFFTPLPLADPVPRGRRLDPCSVAREIADRFREHPGLNVNNGITAWLEDYQRRTRTARERG